IGGRGASHLGWGCRRDTRQLDTFDIGTHPLPLWLFRTGRCTRSITSETPLKVWDLAERVAAHLRVARACVRLLAPPS
ncbi:MAG: hypothetical protein QGG05_19280, partial [Candidatus Latescibacteria bacterium]|nr:hypothetical protein [Candidatus Latescibacterota bacterium]